MSRRQVWDVAEDARRCTKCEYKWYAKRISKPTKTYGAGAGWAALGSTGMAAGAGAKAGAHYSTKLERHERWRNCPRCGSRKVRTEKKREFVPTAADEAAVRAEVPPAAPSPRAAAAAPLPRSAGAASRTEARGDDSPWPRRIRIVGLALLCLVLGPITLVYGGEAVRRRGRNLRALAGDPDSRRPALVAIAGAIGTAVHTGVLVELIAVAGGATPPADGELGVYAVAGIVFGSLIAAALTSAVRRSWFSRLRLPRFLKDSPVGEGRHRAE